MSDLALTKEYLEELSEPWEMGDKIKRAIERAARLAGLSYWRTFDLWYGKARKVEDFEFEMIAEALEKKRREAARNELHELRFRLERLEAYLAQNDPDFTRTRPAEIGQHLRPLGGTGRALARSRDRQAAVGSASR